MTKTAFYIEEFCKCIDDMLEIFDIGENNPELHRIGRKANRLASQLGLITEPQTAQNAKYEAVRALPYVESEWSCDWVIERILRHDTGRVKKLEEWKKRASFLQESVKKTEDEDTTGLITQAEASMGFGIPKSTLAKYSSLKPGDVNFLWSKKIGRHRYYRRKDIEKLTQSRERTAFYSD